MGDVDRASHPSQRRWRAVRVGKPTRKGADDGEFLELLRLARNNAYDSVRGSLENTQPLDATHAIHTLRCLEQTRQEDLTFNARHRHDQQLFGLKLLMARSAYALLILIAVAAFYVIINHRTFSTAVVAEAGTTLLVQTAGLMAWSWRVVVARKEPEPAPLTIAALDITSDPDPTDNADI